MPSPSAIPRSIRAIDERLEKAFGLRYKYYCTASRKCRALLDKPSDLCRNRRCPKPDKRKSRFVDLDIRHQLLRSAQSYLRLDKDQRPVRADKVVTRAGRRHFHYNLPLNLWWDGFEVRRRKPIWVWMLVVACMPWHERFMPSNMIFGGSADGSTSPDGDKVLSHFLRKIPRCGIDGKEDDEAIEFDVGDATVHVHFFITGLCGDIPAQYAALNFGSASSKWPCRVCLVQKAENKINKAQKGCNWMHFPALYTPLRSHKIRKHGRQHKLARALHNSNWRAMADPTKLDGVKATSPLYDEPHFDIARDTLIDDLHTIDLGIVKHVVLALFHRVKDQKPNLLPLGKHFRDCRIAEVNDELRNFAFPKVKPIITIFNYLLYLL